MTDENGGSPLSAGQAWYAVAICMVAYILSFVDRQILALLIGPIQADLGISDTEFGLLSGFAFAIFYATMGIPLAGLSDRVSRPLVISAGVALWSMATLACGFARGFAQLFAARIFVGAGEAALSPATYSLIGDLFPRERLGRAVAVYSMGSFLGTGLAFLAGGGAIALVSGHEAISLFGMAIRPWQTAFLIVGAPGLALALLLALTVRDPRSGGGKAGMATAGAASSVPAPSDLGRVDIRSANSGRADPGATDPAVPGLAAVVRFLVRERAIFGPHIAGYTMTAAALFALLGWSPAYLMRGFGLSAGQGGLWLGGLAIVAGGGGVLASGWLMDGLSRAGRRDAPFLAGMIGAAGAALFGALLMLASTLTMALAAFGGALFFASFPMPPSTAVMQIVAPPAMRSRVAALFLCSNSLIGATLGSLLVGLFNDRLFGGPGGVGLSLGLVVGGASALAAAILSPGRAPMRRFAS